MAKFDIETPEGIRDFSIDRFNLLAGEKYDRGQVEHGGLLKKTVTIEKLEEEILDLWHYVQAKRLQDEELHRENAWLKNQLVTLKNEIFDYEAGRK